MVMIFIAACQTMFLPGWIVYRLCFDSLRLRDALPYIFTLSLGVNWVVGFLLSLMGLYTENSLFVLIALESLIIVYLNAVVCDENRERNFIGAMEADGILRLLSFVTTTIIFCITVVQLVDVFDAGDALVSWNNWAKIWSKNVIPYPYAYPQLLPLNYSITYVLTKTDLQFVPSITSILAIPLAAYALHSTSRILESKRFYAANVAMFASLLVFQVYNERLLRFPNGMNDLSAGATLIIAYCLLQICSNKRLYNIQNICAYYCGAVIASSALLIKQTSIPFAIPLIFYAAWGVYNFDLEKNRKKCTLMALGLMVSVLVVVLPWYIYNFQQIQANGGGSKISYLTSGIFNGLPVFERIVKSIYAYPWYYIITVVAAGSVFIKSKLLDKILQICVIVSLFVWASFLSYDFRNFAPGLLVASLGVGIVLELLIKSESKFPVAFNNNTIAAFLLLGLPLLANTNIAYLVQRQNIEQVFYGAQYIMREQVLFAIQTYGKGKVLSSEGMMAHVSIMPQDIFENFNFSDGSSENIDRLTKFVEESAVKYLIVADNDSALAVKEAIEKLLNEKKIVVYEKMHKSASEFITLYVVN